MACGCSTGCTGACEGKRFTSPTRAGKAGVRLARMYDRARDMQSRAGLRPYSVTIVRMKAASSKRRGDGPWELVAEYPILPTPRIGDLSSLQDVVGADQLREMGTVILSEISLCYTEDMLVGRGPDGTPIPPDEVMFYEIKYLDGNGEATQRRRFVPNGPPSADHQRAQWSLVLTRAHGDRNRAGALR